MCRRGGAPFVGRRAVRALPRVACRAGPTSLARRRRTSVARQRWRRAPPVPWAHATAWRSGVAWLRRHPTAADGRWRWSSRRGVWSRSTRPSSCCGRTPRWRAGPGRIVVTLLAVTLPLAFGGATRCWSPSWSSAPSCRSRAGQPRRAGPGGVGGRRHRLGHLGRAVQRGRARRRDARDRRWWSPPLAVVLMRRGRARDLLRRAAAFGDLPLNQAFLLAYNAVSVALPIALGVAVRALRDREPRTGRADRASCGASGRRTRAAPCSRSASGSRASCTTSSRTTSASWASRPARRGGSWRGGPTRRRRRSASIEASSRQAVVELHRLLGFLRREGQDDALAPQPDLAQLPELIAQATQGELTVEPVGGGRAAAAAGHARALRRTASSRRRSPTRSSTPAAPRRRCASPTGPATLEVEVVDDGRGGGPAGRGGHGLIGMRERVRPARRAPAGRARDPAGGFAVHATLPAERRGA